MKPLCIKDKNTESLDSKEIVLSILFEQNGLSYSIYDKKNSRYQTLVYEPFKVKEVLEINSYFDFLKNENILEQSFSEINIVVADRKSTIVPEALFEEEKIKELYSLNFELKSNCTLLSCSMPKSGNILIYSVENELLNYIKEIFPICNIFPQSYSFVDSHYSKNKIAENANDEKVFVQVFSDFLEIIVLKESELVFYNTFAHKTDNDILYFIVNVFEQLKLSQSNASVGFSGFIEKDSLAVLNLRKFINIVYFESQSADYKYFYKFQEIAPHYFYNFLNVC